MFKNFTRAYLFQIALEIMWLPIQIAHPIYRLVHNLARSAQAAVSKPRYGMEICSFNKRMYGLVSKEIVKQYKI